MSLPLGLPVCGVPQTCPAVVRRLPIQASSEGNVQTDVYQSWLAEKAVRQQTHQGALTSLASDRGVSPGSPQVLYRSVMPPRVQSARTLRGISPGSPQVLHRSTIPPKVQSAQTLLRGVSPYPQVLRSTLPAVARQPMSPAVASRGLSPSLPAKTIAASPTASPPPPAPTQSFQQAEAKPAQLISIIPPANLDHYEEEEEDKKATVPPPPAPTQSFQQAEAKPAQLSSITPPANLDHYEEEEEDKKATVQHHVFNWLNWSPDPDTACYDALHKNFPGALPGAAVHHRVAEALHAPRFGFTIEQTLLGASICPDEINNQVGELADLMKNYWGGIFPLGGISGAPFVGETGFGAFSHHVPDDGDIIILFGPHVAISGEGQVGKYLRHGQHHLSGACGAVIGAYHACCGGAMKNESGLNEHDLQMEWIKTQIGPHAERIKAQSCPMGALAYQAYEMVKAKLEKVVNYDFGKGRLVLVGGIQINMPGTLQDHFLPLMFDVRQKDMPTIDLMSTFKCRFTQVDVFAPVPKRHNSKRRASNLAGTFPVSPTGSERLSPTASEKLAFNEWKDTQCADFDHTAQEIEDRKAIRQHKVFEWLSWGPHLDTPCFKALHTDFPGALPGPGIHHRLKAILCDNYGFTPDNTLFGSSICPDEINNTLKSLTGLMTDFWGSVFTMGGLGGVPFAGKTGFKAFSHHVPDDGNILLLYGPHVAISEEGVVGNYLRHGQHEDSKACGAIIGAYNSCCNMAGNDVEFDEADMQMAWIKSQILPFAERIARQDSPLAALAYQAFESVKAKINKVVDTDFSTGRLVLIGGIQINLPPPCCDHFLPISFEVRQAGQPTECLEQVFHIPFPDENDHFHHQVLGA